MVETRWELLDCFGNATGLDPSVREELIGVLPPCKVESVDGCQREEDILGISEAASIKATRTVPLGMTIWLTSPLRVRTGLLRGTTESFSAWQS